ncbi:Pogo transposable element with KRAB domain [Xyrichtys novacula]|uniref:Pogo transposable element with KRAB domain n=1 Tax=Xyrichtys novacula TaxID=13765 RepID=A0AAV1FAV5_XYRNO|nr:Pogo transposable element with KRAB domain [Xyrichtys novacula]
MYAVVDDKRDGWAFEASVGWLFRFLRRNNFFLRRKTTVAQKDAPIYKIVNLVIYYSRQIQSKKITAKNIIAMDKTAWFDMVGDSTVDARDPHSVSLKTTGHEKARITVALAAKADGTKLKAFVVFKGAVRDAKAIQNIPGAVITSSKNGWFNNDLTKEWLQKVVGKFHLGAQLLAWDAYHCHISMATQAELKRGYGVRGAAMPGRQGAACEGWGGRGGGGGAAEAFEEEHESDEEQEFQNELVIEDESRGVGRRGGG